MPGLQLLKAANHERKRDKKPQTSSEVALFSVLALKFAHISMGFIASGFHNDCKDTVPINDGRSVLGYVFMGR